MKTDAMRVMQKPYNTPKRLEKQGEVVGSTEIKNHRKPAS